MGVVGLGLQWEVENDIAFRTDLQKPGTRAQLGDQGVAVVKPLRGADFAILFAALVGEDGFFVHRDFLDRITPGDERIAVRQDEPIARTAAVLPKRLGILADYRGPAAKDQV